MRRISLAGAALMAATVSHAGSIDTIATGGDSSSITLIKCAHCKPVEEKDPEQPEVVIAPGTQKIELREVDGQLKMFRTEAWLGGSPVTYVSKASPEVIAEVNAADPGADKSVSDAQPIMIDKDATTSAVSADLSGAGPTAGKDAKRFDPSTLNLRVN